MPVSFRGVYQNGSITHGPEILQRASGSWRPAEKHVHGHLITDLIIIACKHTGSNAHKNKYALSAHIRICFQRKASGCNCRQASKQTNSRTCMKLIRPHKHTPVLRHLGSCVRVWLHLLCGLSLYKAELSYDCLSWIMINVGCLQTAVSVCSICLWAVEHSYHSWSEP